MAKWVDEGETLVGNIFLKKATVTDLFIGLYEDVAEPGETDGLAELTEQAVGLGYARQQLVSANWTESPVGTFTNDQYTFTASGGAWGDQYGYFICDVTSGTAGNLVAVEDFSDGPYTVNDGWSVKVTPVVVIA